MAKKFLLVSLMMLIAVLTVACRPVYTYTVSFDTNGGGATMQQRVEDWGTATRPTDPVKEGYVFTGWYLGEQEYTFDQAVTKDITLVAKWERIYYTVTVNLMGAGENQTVEVAHGDLLAVETPSNEGYNFAGWYLGESEYDLATPVTGDMEICAKWVEKVYYKVTVKNEYATEAEVTHDVEENTCFSALEAPSHEGYVFIGWFVGENEYDFATPVTGDVEICAKWEEEITFAEVVGAWAGDETMMGSLMASYDVVIMPDGTGVASYTMYGYEMPLAVTGFAVENNRLVMSYDNYGAPATCAFKLENGKLIAGGMLSGEYGSIELSKKAIDVSAIAKTWEGAEDYEGMQLTYTVVIDASGVVTANIDMFGMPFELTLKELTNKLVLSYMGASDSVLIFDGEKFVGTGVFGGAVVLTEKVIAPSETLTFEVLAGTWVGSEEFYGMVFDYTFVINADGTGTAKYESPGYPTEMEGTTYAIENGKLVLTYKPYGDTYESLTFEYVDGALVGDSPMQTVITLNKALSAQDIAGNWQGTEVTAYGNYIYDFTINADGTGTGTYVDEAGAYPSDMDITAVTVNGNTVTVTYLSYTMEYEIVFTYENGVMTSDMGAMWGALTVEKK